MKIKDFIPPILIRLVKRGSGFDDREYKSYAEALQACTTENAYQNTTLCNMVADKTMIHLERLKNKPFDLNQTDVLLLSAINQYLIIYAKKSLQILDFGGACGNHYFEIRRFIPGDVSLNWNVIDTEQMIKCALEKGLDNAELNFFSSIENIKQEIDLVHSSGALQYVPDPYEFTNMLAGVKANRMFFNRILFNENDRDFITVQKSFLSENGPGELPKGYPDYLLSYPHTTLSFKKFHSIIINNNYTLEWVFNEPTGVYNTKNEKIIIKGLLYVRK